MASSTAKTPLSIGAPTPWPSSSPSSSSLSSSPPPSKAYTYNSNYDCSLSICSANCPQFCSILAAPPPPLFFNPDGGGDDDSSSRISPLMAALIAVLAAFFLLLFYFTVISKLCRRRRNNRRLTEARFLDPETSGRIDSFIHDPARPNTNESGLDDSFIRQITVFKFRREDKLVEGTECAVCLTEFNENENLRLMPNCEHAFHLPCIDPWLKIHSNCPVCRSTMLNPAPAPNPNRSGTGSTGSGGNNNASVAALRVQRSNDAVLVVRELESQVQVVETAPSDEVGSRGRVCRNHTVEDNNNRESKLENNNNNSR